jgi:NAD+ diphosphatase
MLAVHGDRCLMGRQKAWRPGFWSCLAGFVEPGETIEQAAAREVLEEAGVRCTAAPGEYLFCQPWPFPSSLMIGLILYAEDDKITVDAHELETARWFTRDEAKAMMAGTHPEAHAPMRFAVAHHVLKAWLER